MKQVKYNCSFLSNSSLIFLELINSDRWLMQIEQFLSYVMAEQVAFNERMIMSILFQTNALNWIYSTNWL
jgi:hypothetical protein